MLFGNRKPRSSPAGRGGAFRPKGEALESRVVMTAIDLANVAGPPPGGTGAGPFGVQLVGPQNNFGAGFKVADVGDVNGDGYDDFVVTAPSVVRNPELGFALGNGASQVFLVFGSKDVTAGTIDFSTLTQNQRVGDLAQLGNTGQTNPLNNNPTLNYDGLIFTASLSGTSNLGASVAPLGDINGDGFADFMIGAPGANDATGNNPGTGRAYLVYGSASLEQTTKVVDLDNLGASPNINVLTFTNTLPNARTGFSVAAAGDVLTNGRGDIAIGAPGASVNGLSGNGAVYVVDGTALSVARQQTIDLSTIGQPTATFPGVVFAGANSGDHAGYSVAAAGNVDGSRTGGGQSIDDLLIGSPQLSPTTTGITGPGIAYLVYGATNLGTLEQASGTFFSIDLGRVGSPATTGSVPGAAFVGAASGDFTGFAVSSARDFNGDGLADIMIGSPGFSNSAGRVSLILGRAASGTTGRINGQFTLDGLDAASIDHVEFDGANNGDLAGYALGFVGSLNRNPLVDILIGAPGAQALAGVVYLIPGNPDLLGTQTLSTSAVQGAPVLATVITDSTPPPTGTGFFLGSSVSGNLLPNRQNRTIDGDLAPDFIIGAAGFSLPSGRVSAGAAFALEGRFIPLNTPVSTALTVTVGIDKPNPPFIVKSDTPDTVKIFVFSDATTNPPFDPVLDIDPKTIVVNGVAFPNATIAADPVDENGDGIEDAIITITPRSALKLTAAVTSIVVSGRTLRASPFAGKRFTGTANVTVVEPGGGGGGGGGTSNGRLITNFGFTGNNPPDFGTRLVPSVAALSPLRWTRLPLRVAVRQFLPAAGFAQRQQQFFHPKRHGRDSHDLHGHTNGRTLKPQVFTRGQFRLGELHPRRHKNK